MRVDRVHAVNKYLGHDGRGRCSGSKDLKSTQSYPLPFGASHALAYEQWRAAPTAQPLPHPLLEQSTCWFLEDLADSSFEWHTNSTKEQQLPLGASSSSAALRGRSRSR